MSKKKLFTLDDLAEYCLKNKVMKFNSDDDNTLICVQVDGSLKFEEEDKNTEGLTPVILRANHIGKNLNRSYITKSAQESALKSFLNRPILGYIHEVDGQDEFYSHNMHEDEDGNIIYDEIPVGIIPESADPHLEYVEEFDKEYVIVKGYLFDDYTKASEILNREKECDVSVELCIREMSFNNDENALQLDDFYYSGVTILGKDEDGIDVEPGMAHSNITLADFSSDNNSLFNHEDLIKRVAKMEEILASFNIDENLSQSLKEGGKHMDKIQELLEKYEITEDDITFETEGLSDEELEEKFAEAFESNDPSPEEDEQEEPEVDESEESEEENEPKDDEATEYQKFTVINDKTAVVSFEISHEDLRMALYQLIKQFDEMDNDYYWIESVFDEYFTFTGWESCETYGCKYVKDDSSVSLEGERYRLYKELLTESELASLKEMRENYSKMQSELNEYRSKEENSLKDEIFADECYASYLETDEFKQLLENKDNYSVDELKDRVEIAFARCVKKAGNFELKDSKITNRRSFSSANKEEDKADPYNGLFTKEEIENDEKLQGGK